MPKRTPKGFPTKRYLKSQVMEYVGEYYYSVLREIANDLERAEMASDPRVAMLEDNLFKTPKVARVVTIVFDKDPDAPRERRVSGTILFE